MGDFFLGLRALRNSAKHGQIEKGRGMAERWGVDTVDDAGAALTEEEAEQMWKRSSEFDGPGPLVLDPSRTKSKNMVEILFTLGIKLNYNTHVLRWIKLV